MNEDKKSFDEWAQDQETIAEEAWAQSRQFPYTPPSAEQLRAEEISASMKRAHDNFTAYCQWCWMKLAECPGHTENIPRVHGPFYIQLLKERTLLREAWAADQTDWDVYEALENLEVVFDRYEERLELENEHYPTGGIRQDFDAFQEDYNTIIPLQLSGDIVHTKVVNDQLADHGPKERTPESFAEHNYQPGSMWVDTVLDEDHIEFNPETVEDTVTDRFTEAYNQQLAEQVTRQMEGYLSTESIEQANHAYWLQNHEVVKEQLGIKEEGPLTNPDLIAANQRLNGGEGRKDDAGKERWDLLPPSIEHVVEVYTIGAKKYDDDNWAKGMGYRRIFGAMMRHAWKWFWGESYDPVDGQHHLASVAWACLTLMHYEDEGVGTDDRAFKPLEKAPRPVYGVEPFGFSFTIGGNEPKN